MDGEIGNPQLGQAALPRAQNLARAAEPQILLRDAEAVLGLAHDGEPRPRRLPKGRGIEQKAGGRLVAAADAAAKLVELGEAETLGMLDHHHRRIGHIDADLDHGRGDEEIDGARSEALHDAVLVHAFHAAMHQADTFTEECLELRMALIGGGEIDRLGFRDERADPIDFGALIQGPLHAIDHLVDPRQRERARGDRPASGRLLG